MKHLLQTHNATALYGRALKIGVILSNFEKSGVTSNTIDLCEGLKKDGHDVTLIIGRPKHDFQISKSDYLKEIGVRQIYFSDLREGFFSRISAFAQLSGIILKCNFDILHFESIYLTFIPKLLHKKFVLTYHSFGLKNNIFSQHATRLISISEGITQDAIARHGYKPKEIDVVLHGVSKKYAETYSANEQVRIREQLKVPPQKLIIGIVASIEPRKGHHFLLDAISRLPIEKRNLIHIIFCGNYKGFNSENWIKEQIANFNLTDNVTIIGFQNPLKIYQALDVFCLPSIWEGFPLTAIEAMLARCCVVRSNVQGAKEQIIEGVTGFTFESENPESLKNILEYLFDNKAIITSVAKSARDYALEHFTLDVMTANTLSVYYKVLSDK